MGMSHFHYYCDIMSHFDVTLSPIYAANANRRILKNMWGGLEDPFALLVAGLPIRFWLVVAITTLSILQYVAQ